MQEWPSAFVAIDEVLQEERNVTLLQVAAPAQLLGDVGGNVLRPFFGGIEADHANRVFILAGQQVENDGLELGRAVVGFAPDPAEPAEVVYHQADVMIVAVGHDHAFT